MAPTSWNEGQQKPPWTRVTTRNGRSLAGHYEYRKKGHTNEPVLGESDLEEQNTLRVTEVLDNTTAIQEEGSSENPGTSSKQYSQNRRDDPDLG